MKTCPKCGELLGDSVKTCIKCRYNFEYGRIITAEEAAEQRNKQEEQKQKHLEEAKLREEYKKVQLMKNPLFEYKTVVITDSISGHVDVEELQRTLVEWSEKGWRLHTIFTNEIGKSTSSVSVGGYSSGTNATIDQIVMIFERCIKAENRSET